MRKLCRSGIAAIALCGVISLGNLASAGEKPAAGQAAAGQADKQPATGQPQMTDEQRQMMEAYMKAATPGPEHARMAATAGDWEAEVNAYMDPSAPPQTSKSTVKREVLMDGRFIQSKWKGEMGGAPFMGMEIMGYDNAEGVYWSLWIDNMGTGSMMMKGKFEGDTLVMKGEAFEPATKSMVTYTTKTMHKGPDQASFQMFRAEKDGAQTKCLEITMMRKKEA